MLIDLKKNKRLKLRLVWDPINNALIKLKVSLKIECETHAKSDHITYCKIIFAIY